MKHWRKDWKRIYSYTAKNRTHKKEVNKIISIVGEFDLFIDCGAGNVGSEAWSVKDKLPECTIVGLEPQDERFDLLKKYNYPDILLKKAISFESGEAVGFMGHKKGKSDFWLIGGEDLCKEDAYKEEKIETTTLDEIVKEHASAKRVFVWADIEGSELLMLKGCSDFSKFVGFNLELWEDNEQKSYKREDVIEYLRDKGYDCHPNRGNDYIFFKR
jgi:FkbM family methyltransferase